ncbi:MAG: VWA domain-containing protein [Nibricoccus sp.]
MKTNFISKIAAALVGVLSLVACSAKSPEETVQLRIDVDRSVLPAGSTSRAVVKVCLDGLRLPRAEARPPVNLSLVIDRSGSMEGEKLARAREAALEALSRLAPDDILSVVTYDTEVQTLVPAQRVGDGRAIGAAIRGIRSGGSTALFGGVSQGASEVRKHIENRRYVHRVILLSDGLANVGPQSPEELGRLGAALVKEGISVTTIGLGLGFNEDLMTRLAQRSDGNTYFVESSDDLPRIFAGELGDVLSVIARRVVVEVVFPEGVRPLHFVGREGTIRGQKAELSMNQLYGGQEKFALIEVEVPGNRAGEEIEIASAQLSYENAVTQKTSVARAQRKIIFSGVREEVVASANLKVQNDYAVNVIAVTKDKAVDLVDADRRADAAQALRQKAAELKTTAAAYGNAPMAALAAKQEQEADRLEKEGLSNAARKTYRAESVQIMNQQSASK